MGGVHAEGGSSRLRDWELLRVSVCIAPESAISLMLYDEGEGEETRRQRPEPIAEIAIRNVAISYVSFGDASSRVEARVGVVEATDSRPSAANVFRQV